MGIDDGFCLFETEPALLIHIPVIYMHIHNFCEKHDMASEFLLFDHATFDIHRALSHHGDRHKICFFLGKLQALPLIFISSTSDTTIICSLHKCLGREVDNEDSCIMKRLIGIPYLLDRDR